jgi:hypothetical protein
MASKNLRIFGGSPRPFSQVGTDEQKTRDIVCIGRIFRAGQLFGPD